MHWILLILLFILSGCDNEKSSGPAPILPETGTTLYFAECNPASNAGLGSLSPDGTNICGSDVLLFGNQYIWRSNVFYHVTGSITEGFHLVFERDIDAAEDTSFVSVTFDGIANHFTRTLVLPPGELISTREDAEAADAIISPDSGASVSIAIGASDVRMSTGIGGGSHLVIGVDRNMLCEFAIYQGFTGGEGEPNNSVNFSYLHTSDAITAGMYLDFTGGASFTEQLFTFGPHYGVAYLVAQSGQCRDTALFYAPPPAQGFRVDTLDGQFYALTDGQVFWPYTIDYGSDTAGSCQHVRIYFPSNLIMIDRLFASCIDPASVIYDQFNHLIWLIQRSVSLPDTAWGYDTNGILDTTVIATAIPDGDLVRGQWVTSTVNAYVRQLYMTPFAGGTPTHTGDIPTILAADFSGRAGITPANATNLDEWTVNVFDSLGHWVARYPIRSQTSDSTTVQALSAALIAADSVIVYEAFFSDFHYEFQALKP